MCRLWWLVGIMALELACGAASAQNSAVQGYCQNGGVKVSVSGTLSTNTVQASYPKCIVTVFLTGTTTPATIYSNATGTPLSNPFTANTNGLWLFYAATGSGYDVTLTGGTPIAMPFPVTLTDIVIGGGGSGGVISINGTPGAYTFTGSGVSCVGTTCTFSGTGGGVSSVTGAAGNRAAGITPTTGAVIVTTFDQQLYASQFSTIPALVTACGSTATKITVDTAQSFTLAANQTFPSNCAFNYVQGGVWTTAGAFTLTFNGTVDGNASSHFAGAATVKLGTLVTSVPVEWFGGKNDATGAVGVGTDNLAAFNAAVASLSAGTIIGMPSVGSTGFYRISGPIAIAKPNVGISGTVASGPNGMTILIDSASADAIDLNPGVSFNTFKNFNIYRTQLATGTAAGLAIYGTNHPDGIVVDGVISDDSMYPFYMEGLSQFGPGNFINNSANWQVNGLLGSSPSGACGFFVDSTTFGAGFKTQFSGPNSSSTGGTGVGLTAFCAKGDNISELEIDDFKMGGMDYGIDLENTGTSSYTAQSIHIVNSDLAPCSVACITMNGVGGANDLGPHVFIQGGIIFATGTGAVGVLATNSTNISVDGVQFLAGSVGTAAQTDISLSAVDGFTINDNQFTGGSLVNVSCLNSTHGTINDNQVKTNNTATGATGIKIVGCTKVAIQGNTISGGSLSNLATGISFDSDSSNNGPWSLNTIDATTVNTPVNDAGTNNNALTPTSVAINTGTAMNANQGTGLKVQHSTGTTTTNDCVKFDANGNTVDAGSGCGSGTPTIIQVNGTPTSTATPVNLQTSTANTVGLTVTPSNPSVGNVKLEIAGAAPSFGTSVTAPTHIGTIPGSSAQGAFAIGTLPYSDTGIGLSIAGNTNSYVQGIVSNANAGTAASADFIVSNDQGTATTHYGDFGINSSAFSGSGNLTGIAGETYVYGNGGDLGLGTLTNNPVHLVVNNNGTDSITLNTGGTVSVPSLNSGGLTKSIVSSGLLSVAVPGTDYQVPIVCPTTNAFLYQGGSGITCGADVKYGGAGGLLLITTNTATNVANFNSPLFEVAGSFWTGTAGATDDWTTINTLGSGTNPTSTLTFAHSGSSGAAAVSIPALIVSSLGSSTSPICPNGTGNALTTSGCASGLTNPMTMLGDTIYGASSGTPTRLAGPTTAATYILSETATGSAVAPVWLNLASTGKPIGGTTGTFSGAISATNAVLSSTISAVGASNFTMGSSGSEGDPVALINNGSGVNSAVGELFDLTNASFSNYVGGKILATQTANTAGAESSTLTISHRQAGAAQVDLTFSGGGNGVETGTITSALGNAAITSATGASGVTSVTCQTAACNVSRGSYTVVGGTATTGTIVTLVWPTTTTAWVCSADMNGGTGFLGIGHSVATATGMNITAGITVVGTTFTFDYNCVP